MRKARGLDQRRSPERTLAVINQLDADVVLLQEADKRLGQRKPAIPRDMIAKETDLHLVEVSENQISLGWHGNAILVRDPSLILAYQTLLLPGLEPRGAVQLSLDFGAGLSVTATHLGLRRKDRLAQLDLLSAQNKDHAHAIIAGDFNEWSGENGFDPLADRFTLHAPGLTFHARRPMAALDRFATTAGVKVTDAGVSQGALAKMASDHLPIWSDVMVPTL